MNVTDTSVPADHFLPAKGDIASLASKSFVVGSSRISPSGAEGARARHRASRTKKRTPQGRLARALVHGTGHVAVIGRNVEDAGRFLYEVVERIGVHRLVHVAADADDQTVSRALLDGSNAWVDGESVSATRAALTSLLDTARRERSPILVVADGADRATAAQLDRLRLSLEFAPDALGTVKLVLLGTTSLERTLSKPSARSLASRISARVEAPVVGRLQAALPLRFSEASWSARTVTLSAAAAALLALVLPLMSNRASTGLDGGTRAASVTPVETSMHIDAVKTATPSRSKPVRSHAKKPDAPAPKLALAATGFPPVRVAKHAPPTPATPAAGSAKPAAIAPSASAMPTAPAKTAMGVVASPGPHRAGPTQAHRTDVVTYALQVGSFRNAANAARLERSLAERFGTVGMSRFERDGIVYHRVRIGGLSGRPATDRAAAELAAIGLEPLRIRTSRAAANH